MDYLTAWAQNVIKRRSIVLQKAIEVEGTCDAHLGPRWEFAKIKVKAEPSDGFIVHFDINTSKQEKLNGEGYLQAAVFGLCDVLLVSNQAPLKDICITFLDAEEHEVDSSQNAFRMAGRNAGRKIMEMMLSPTTRN
jgi:translation elongation factor EF-G